MLKALIDASPVAIMLLDNSRRVSAWNLAAERLFGRSRADVLRKLPSPEFLLEMPALGEALERLSRGEAIHGLKLKRRVDDNDDKNVELWGAPVHDSKQAVIGVVSMFLDVTQRDLQQQALAESISDRKLMSEELVTSERQLRAIFDGVFDAIVLVDDRCRCEDVNHAGCELLSRTRNEIVGEVISSFATPDWGIAERLHNPVAVGPVVGQACLRCPTGEVRDVEYRVKAHVLPGRHLLVMRDISERKALEQQFQQSQKMEAIGRLAGGVAHDFNNMLTVISGYGELLLKKLEDGHPLRRYATGIMNAADRSANITRQLLAFSRRQVMQPCVLDINSVVEGMSGLLQRLIGEDIELRTSLAPHLGLVKADPAQISQILLNLAVNARDAMAGGGRLLITTENADMDATYCSSHVTSIPGPYVQLTVNDCGCGMDSELRSHIFEPFFTTKDQGNGTGLGLATVYGIVKQSGGYIWVYSEKGEGTTFKIYLPRVDASDGEVACEIQVSDRGRGETLLVIEDDAGARPLLCELLGEAGYRVLSASGGDEALTICQEQNEKIDLMLTDVVMSGTSGQDLSGYVRARYPSAPVLYMSGFPKEELVARGIFAESDYLLQKPFRTVDLLKRIRKCLDAACS